MKQKLQKVTQWIKTHRTQSIGVAGVFIILAGVGVAAWAYDSTRPAPIDNTPIAVKKPTPKYYSLLTGREVKDEKSSTAPVTAIMIENSPAARPHSGLKEAGVVYEAVAEAGITRYLALYQDKKPSGQIGPVRSLREYFVDWVAPYQASVAHVGGSSQALKIIRNGQYRDVDEFFNAGTFWRATDRYAPHNVYTNFQRLDAYNKQKNWSKSEFKTFARTDGKASKKPTARDITINFSSQTYNTRYVYNPKNNNYVRHLAGATHKDREKGAITPSVVVALRVDETTVMQDGLRENIKTSGSGKATIFQNGQAIDATWRKKSRSEPLELINSESKPIELVRGQTWIAAVPNGKGSIKW